MTKEQSYINKGTTLKELIYNAAGEFPNNNAFRFKEKGVIKTESFSQLIRDIEAMGTAMFTRNFDGKNIGIIGENSFQWYLCYLAVVCGGNIAVPFDKGLTARELENCVERSDIEFLFYDLKHKDMIEEIRGIFSDKVEFLLSLIHISEPTRR